MHLSVKLFLGDKGTYSFGPGRLALLKEVHASGSLRKAAQNMGMSYRWAWGRLNKAEQELGVCLLTRTSGPVCGRPMVLTDEALEIIAWFEQMEARVHSLLREEEKSLPRCLRQAADAGA